MREDRQNCPLFSLHTNFKWLSFLPQYGAEAAGLMDSVLYIYRLYSSFVVPENC
jgi:hypothetical protein